MGPLFKLCLSLAYDLPDTGMKNLGFNNYHSRLLLASNLMVNKGEARKDFGMECIPCRPRNSYPQACDY
jgi:hypothetical protein